jgi:hypothetical protein
MNIVHQLALSATAAVLAISGAASAADLFKGPYEINGYITQSTCGSLSPSLQTGTATHAWAYYPGAGKTGFQLATPATSPTGGAGDAATQVCTTIFAVPAAGLNGAGITFSCYNDTVKGKASSAEAQLQSTFKDGASHSTSVWQVTTTSNLIVGGVTACNFTSDATWTLE